MENATKALIMAAGILIGIMVISLAVYLFTSFGKYGNSFSQKSYEKEISEFNANFTKYYGSNVTATIHEIITLANLAKENNTRYNLDRNSVNIDDENNYYIRVDLIPLKLNLQEEPEEDCYDILNAYTDKVFECTEIKTSDITKRVKRIIFEEKLP